jgi:hypothetical protein
MLPPKLLADYGPSPGVFLVDNAAWERDELVGFVPPSSFTTSIRRPQRKKRISSSRTMGGTTAASQERCLKSPTRSCSRQTNTKSRSPRASRPGQDLVATPTGEYGISAIIPLLSIISLGIVPTVFQDKQCDGMLPPTAAGRPKRESVRVDVRYKGAVVMGWAAVVVGALPGWSYGEVADDERFAARFRVAAIRKRPDIERLLGR